MVLKTYGKIEEENIINRKKYADVIF